MKLTERIYFYEGDYLSRTRLIYKGLGSSNFLVIKGPDQVMIDSGMTDGPHRKRVNRELNNDGIDLGNTTRILLSHTHPDHFLHAKSLSRKNPVSFMLHADGEPFARRSRFQFEAHYNFPCFIQREVFNWPVWIARLAVNRYFGFDYLKIQHMLYGNDRIDLGVPAEIIDLPSHFPGHIGVYFRESRIFYAADLFDFRVAEGGIINSALSSYSQVFEDIKKVRELDIEIMLPGHGRIIKGKSLVKTTLDRVEKGTRKYAADITAILELFRGKRVTLNGITEKVFPGSHAYNLSARKIIVYNTLMHLRSSGKVDFNVKSGAALWRLV